MEVWDFGRAVRHWRERLTPEEVGVPAGARRRSVGLRREELAGLAGISVDYLTRLEQGRANSPSTQVVEALARALRVSPAERDLLFELSGQSAPGPQVVPSAVPASVQRLLDRLAGTPVAVYDAAWNLLIANRHYDALMGDTSTWHGWERNAVWRNLLGAGNRTVQSPQEQARFEARLVGDLRRTATRYPADHGLDRLVAELRRSSSRFVERWSEAEVAATEDRARHKVVDHLEVGPIALDCDVLIVDGDDLRIMVYTAEPGSEDAERLALALVMGTQAISR